MQLRVKAGHVASGILLLVFAHLEELPRDTSLTIGDRDNSTPQLRLLTSLELAVLGRGKFLVSRCYRGLGHNGSGEDIPVSNEIGIGHEITLAKGWALNEVAAFSLITRFRRGCRCGKNHLVLCVGFAAEI